MHDVNYSGNAKHQRQADTEQSVKSAEKHSVDDGPDPNHLRHHSVGGSRSKVGAGQFVGIEAPAFAVQGHAALQEAVDSVGCR